MGQVFLRRLNMNDLLGVPPLWMCIPFAGLLLSIAIIPLVKDMLFCDISSTDALELSAKENLNS